MKEAKTIEQLTKQALADRQELSSEVQVKLARARAKALMVANQPANSHYWKEIMAVAACVSLFVPAWFLDWPLNEPTIENVAVSETSNFEVMLAMAQINEEEWEVVDDLEFALWLSEQAAHTQEVNNS